VEFGLKDLQIVLCELSYCVNYHIVNYIWISWTIWRDSQV